MTENRPLSSPGSTVLRSGRSGFFFLSFKGDTCMAEHEGTVLCSTLSVDRKRTVPICSVISFRLEMASPGRSALPPSDKRCRTLNIWHIHEEPDGVCVRCGRHDSGALTARPGYIRRRPVREFSFPCSFSDPPFLRRPLRCFFLQTFCRLSILYTQETAPWHGQ